LSYAVKRRRSFGSFGKAKHAHNLRSNRAKCIDEGLRATIAKSEAQWLAQPNRFDLPDIDTPEETEEPSARPQEPSPVGSREFRERLNMHKYCGTGR
jgi:hypothetical protein